MYWLIALGILALVLASLAMPWVQRVQIMELRREIRGLRALLERQILSAPPPPVRDAAPASPGKQIAPKPAAVPPRPRQKIRINFEQQFGARLPVWIGGIALALAGFFMVKYSIETGLLSPGVRVALGLVFGVGLLYAAKEIRRRPGVANGARIAQAICGAGIADLYVCVFAATSLYNLVPPLAGFTGMAAVTAAAVILALLHGAPIALMGLVGGFLTPALIRSGNPDASLLFFYLYLVFAGIFFVIRKEGWWWLAIPAVLGGFLWILGWLFSPYHTPADSLELGLFLLACGATMVFFSRRAEMPEPKRRIGLRHTLNALTLAGGALLMAAVSMRGGLGTL